MVISRRSRAAQASKTTDDSAQLSPSEEKKSLPFSKDNSDLGSKENIAGSKEDKESDDSFVYKKDETVLCYHGPLLYEGKILKVEMWDAEKIAWYKKVKNRTTPKVPKDNSFNIPGARYEIHYKGWKQRWDEWVTASRILKWTPANLALQDSLNGKTTSIEGGSRKTVNSAATATPKSNSTPKPATPGARSSRNGTKSSTPSAVDGSPTAISTSPALTISKRKSVEVPELKEFKSKRLQAIRTNQSTADSPRSLASELEISARSRSSTQVNLREGTGETKEISPMHQEVDKSDSRARNSELRNKRKVVPEPLAPNTLRAHETTQESTAPIMDLTIPESLKVYLVDQWDVITRGLQLVPLPRVPSVRTILSDFRAFYIGKVLEEAKLVNNVTKETRLPSKETMKDSSNVAIESNIPHVISCAESQSKDSPEHSLCNISPSIQTQMDIIHEVLDGLALYFTKTLGTYLLYRFERPQYADLLSKYPRSRFSNDFVYSFESSESSKISKSTYSPGSGQKNEFDSNHSSDLELLDIYGAEHLIRLFVHLPQLLSRSDLDLEGVRRIQKPLSELLNYLAFHQKDLFCDHYENAAPSYVNTVRLE